MKKIMVTCIGLFFVMAFAASNAAPLMPNATVVKTNLKLANNTIHGLVINQGVSAIPAYLFWKIPGATFPGEVDAKSSGSYSLDIEPTGEWTTPIFYGDNKESQSGSNGAYFQFQLLQSGDLIIAYATQGEAKCSVSATMLLIDYTI